MGKAIGIDLGTTNSCVAVFSKGRVEIILNEKRTRTNPSVVACTGSGVLVGEAAKDQILVDAANTVVDAKRIMGIKFSGEFVQKNLKYWPFSVINDEDKTVFEVDLKGEKIKLTPEEITAKVLSRMKELAEKHLGDEVTDAVITIPASFNDAQRQATRDAGKLAGLNVLRLLHEPTAAVVAFGLEKNVKKDMTVLMYALGAGSLDVSVVKISGTTFEVKSVAGNTHLGGIDFDNKMLDYFVREIRRNMKEDISEDRVALQRLRVACEQAKHTLSSTKEAKIEIKSLIKGADFTSSITRETFDQICEDLFKSAIEPVETALSYAKLDKSDIDDIVLVGGSTKILKIQKMLKDCMRGKLLNKAIHADESVAYGAAILAAVLSGVDDKDLGGLHLVDVNPFSIGFENRSTGGVMSVVVPRNSPIPSKSSHIFTTLSDNNPNVYIKVFEGERAMAKDNDHLGYFELTGIQLALRGIPQINVTFEVDSDGILSITAKENSEEPSDENKNPVEVKQISISEFKSENVDAA